MKAILRFIDKYLMRWYIVFPLIALYAYWIITTSTWLESLQYFTIFIIVAIFSYFSSKKS